MTVGSLALAFRLFVVRRETSDDARNQDSWHIHVAIDRFCLPVAGSNVMKMTEIVIFIVLNLWQQRNMNSIARIEVKIVFV